MTDAPLRLNWDALLKQLEDDGARQRRAQRSAEHEAARTDPWRWYCRLCGAEGDGPAREDRNHDALEHLALEHKAGAQLGTGESGRLLHVWRY